MKSTLQAFILQRKISTTKIIIKFFIRILKSEKIGRQITHDARIRRIIREYQNYKNRTMNSLK